MTQSHLFFIILIVVIILILFYNQVHHKIENYDPNSIVICKTTTKFGCGGRKAVSTLAGKYVWETLMSRTNGLTLDMLPSIYHNKTIYFNGQFFDIKPIVALYHDTNYINLNTLLYLVKDNVSLNLTYKKIYNPSVDSSTPISQKNIMSFKSVKWLMPPENVQILNVVNGKIFKKALKLIIYKDTNAVGKAIKATLDIPDLSIYNFQTSIMPCVCLTTREVE